MIPSPELAILRFLAGRAHAVVDEIGPACWMNTAEGRARLAALQSMRLVTVRSASDGGRPRRIYSITGEGRLKARIGDACAMVNP